VFERLNIGTPHRERSRARNRINEDGVARITQDYLNDMWRRPAQRRRPPHVPA